MPDPVCDGCEPSLHSCSHFSRILGASSVKCEEQVVRSLDLKAACKTSCVQTGQASSLWWGRCFLPRIVGSQLDYRANCVPRAGEAKQAQERWCRWWPTPPLPLAELCPRVLDTSAVCGCPCRSNSQTTGAGKRAPLDPIPGLFAIQLSVSQGHGTVV